MSDIAFIRFIHPITWNGETQPKLPVVGHEAATTITLKDGVFTAVEGAQRLEIPLHNVYCFKYAAPASPKGK